MQRDYLRDLHTGQNDDQFGHLPLAGDEESKVQHRAAAHMDDDSDGESEDSSAGPSRWMQPSSLEMDCIFLEDENTKEENFLPQIFDIDSIHQLDSRVCMLCSETFGRMRMIFKHNCKRCGKAVCENCSKVQRRLCVIDTKKHRVCDECDALLANHLLEQMFEREVQTKKQAYEDASAQLKDTKVSLNEAKDALEHAKQVWEDKTRETDRRVEIREEQMKTRSAQTQSLKNEIASL